MYKKFDHWISIPPPDSTLALTQNSNPITVGQVLRMTSQWVDDFKRRCFRHDNLAVLTEYMTVTDGGQMDRQLANYGVCLLQIGVLLKWLYGLS